MDDTTAPILDQAEAAALALAVTAEQRRAIAMAFRAARTQMEDRGLTEAALDCVRIPRLVFAAVRADAARAEPLAVALTVLYVGLDLWDSVMDGELGPEWAGSRPDAVSLTAAALIGGVAPALLAELAAPASTLILAQCALARAFVAVAAGQHLDLALNSDSREMTEAAAEALAGKSGAVVALFAELAALLAGAASPDVAEFAEMGRSIGAATQIRSDLYDLLLAPAGRDLENGTWSLPLALHLDGLRDRERAAFVARRAEAGSSATVRAALRDELRCSVAIGACAGMIELYCERARAVVRRMRLAEPARGDFFRLLDSLSFVRPSLDRR